MSTKTTTYTLEYPYTRTTGPVVGRFLTNLRDGKLIGVRVGGKVICPPVEWDPETNRTIEDPDYVEVGPGGTVKTATWIHQPTPKHPFQEPFAFALIDLDGCDTPFLHAVQASGPDAVKPGTRVKAQYREERTNAITDVYFVLEAEARDQYIEAGPGEVEMVEHLISIDFEEIMSPTRVRFIEGLKQGKFIGGKSPASGKVYIPSKGYDHIERVPMDESHEVEVQQTGTVCAYTIITPVQYYGQEETEPYIRCSILLDGSDQVLGQQDIRDIPVDQFRAGMRVKAIWKSEAERDTSEIDNRWGGTGACLERWEPLDEPDVPFEKFSEHVF